MSIYGSAPLLSESPIDTLGFLVKWMRTLRIQTNNHAVNDFF